MNTRLSLTLIIIFCIISGFAQCENKADPSLVRTWGFKAEGEFGMRGPRMSELRQSITAVSYESFTDKQGTPRLLRLKIEFRSDAGFTVTMLMDLLGETSRVIASLHPVIDNSVATIAQRLDRYETVPLPTGSLNVAFDYKGRKFTGFKAENSLGRAGKALVERRWRESGEFLEVQSLGLYTMVEPILHLLPGHAETGDVKIQEVDE